VLPWTAIHGLQRLVDERSGPGAAVSVSDLVNEAVMAYLDRHAEQLQTLYAADEQAELERVVAVHGGGEAA
jgi:hypothetical protein